LTFNSSSSNLILTGKFGLTNITPDKVLDVSGDYRFASAPNTELDSSGVGYGEVVYIGSSATTAGDLYYLNSSGGWTQANASATASSIQMIAIAMGSNSGTNGMLIRGFFRSSSFPTSGAVIGEDVYLATTAGDIQFTPPSSSGQVVRIVGYIIGTTTNTRIYFNPSNEWIEI